MTTQKRVIIEKGVLKGFLYNTIVGSGPGSRARATPRAEGSRACRASARTTSTLRRERAKPEDIIKATKAGLWLKEVTGYGINPVNGNSAAGRPGFWIEDGKVAFPVKGLTVAGTADEMFNGIDMLGDDLDLNRGTAAPTFRIKLLQIGGE